MVRISLIITVLVVSNGLLTTKTVGLPPSEDIPEEVLRQEIIVEGRSPLDGQPLTGGEYAEIRQELSQSKYPEQLPSEIRQKVFLLELLHFLRTITPL